MLEKNNFAIEIFYIHRVCAIAQGNSPIGIKDVESFNHLKF